MWMCFVLYCFSPLLYTACSRYCVPIYLLSVHDKENSTFCERNTNGVEQKGVILVCQFFFFFKITSMLRAFVRFLRRLIDLIGFLMQIQFRNMIKSPYFLHQKLKKLKLIRCSLILNLKSSFLWESNAHINLSILFCSVCESCQCMYSPQESRTMSRFYSW